MATKIKIAVNWAASCGGCDVALLDIEEHLLELAGIADIVYWPVAMDFKGEEFLALPPGSVDFGLFNGAIRTSEHLEFAEAFREKCKVLVSFGSCSCFGGIPGLANLSDRDEIFEVAYQTTASTENPDGLRPRPESEVEGHRLTLPSFNETVQSLGQLVDVDVLLPGCPPPTERILDLIGAVEAYVENGSLPPHGTVIGDEKALCASCPRERKGDRIAEIHRPHEIIADSNTCFLDQGLLCMGLATRGGCEATCIQANMPCRGCFGPTSSMLDPGAEAISAFGSIVGEANENHVPAHIMKKATLSILDPAGTFYRYALPTALVSRAVNDKPKGEKP